MRWGWRGGGGVGGRWGRGAGLEVFHQVVGGGGEEGVRGEGEKGREGEDVP